MAKDKNWNEEDGGRREGWGRGGGRQKGVTTGAFLALIIYLIFTSFSHPRSFWQSTFLVLLILPYVSSSLSLSSLNVKNVQKSNKDKAVMETQVAYQEEILNYLFVYLSISLDIFNKDIFLIHKKHLTIRLSLYLFQPAYLARIFLIHK